MSILTAVTDPFVADQPVSDTPAIPDFEGVKVDLTKARVTSTNRLEIDDRVLRMDDTVKLLIECRVQGVDHKVNPSGQLERIHLLKAMNSLVLDWDMDLDELREHL
jgi:hypothetical protein